MQPKPDKCPVCAEALRPHLAKRRVTIFECATCDHRVAVHADAAVAGEGDYHAQYDQGAFLSSLERTRQRQARLFIRASGSSPAKMRRSSTTDREEDGFSSRVATPASRKLPAPTRRRWR